MKKLLLLILGAYMAVSSVQGEPTTSLTFNGTDQYIRIPNSASFQMTADQSLSFSMWVNPSSWTNAARFLGYRAGDDKESGYEAYIHTSGYACTATGVINESGTGGSRPIDTAISSGDASNQWTHIVVVFDRANQKSVAYVNGVLKEEGTLTSEMVFASTRDILIGAGWNADGAVDRYFTGKIANVRFYRGALTAEQVQFDMSANTYSDLSQDLKNICVAAYNMDDNYTPLTLTDQSDNGNHGKFVGYTSQYCEPTETLTRPDRTDGGATNNRYVTSIQITGATYLGEAQTINLTGMSQEPRRCVYENHTDSILYCTPGDVLSPVINFTGDWMHKYVYVDWDRNSIFEIAEGTPGVTTDWGELVSANYLTETDVKDKDGYTSAGTTGVRRGTTALPTFTVPQDAAGDYRIRFKVDWYSTDPCGNNSSSNSILNNGGAILDYTIHVDMLPTADPVITLSSGSNIEKGVTLIPVSCATDGAVIYYTTDGSDPIETSATASEGKISVDASNIALGDKITVKIAAKAPNAKISNVVSAEYVVYPYSYVPVNYTTTGNNGNAANITSITTSREGGYNLNYSRAAVNDANYLQVIGAEESGFRVKRGETFDLTFMWSNAWWNGFSMFMDKGTGTLEEIFYGCGAKDDIVADTDRGEVKLSVNPTAPSSKSITISPDAEYGEYMIRARVTNTHEIGVSARDQKIVDIFYLVCPAITVNAADAAEGTVSVEVDGKASEQLNADKTYLIPVGNPITLTAVPAEMYVFSKWVDANESELSTEATYTFNSSDNITVKAVFVPNNIDITSDLEETEDVTYAVVTLSLDETTQSEPVWKVGTHQTEAEELVIDVEADGATPEISIDGNGSISAQTIKVVRKITSDQWTLMSMPFTFNLSEVQVNGVAANYNDNIRIKEYDAALRANNSVDGYTASGWVEKTSGTIAANEGFAIVVNPANGAEQTVTFTTTGFTMEANDKQITFTEQPSNANVINGKSMDSDWNLKGNPMLQSAEKGQGYTLYVHEAGTNTYRELSSTDQHTYSPFVAWFVQCDNDGGFMNLTFSHNGTSTYGSSMEDNITGRFDILINGGEDEARVTVLEGSSESYVRNEDAMYFAPLNNKISQLYLIDKEGAQIASSVVPAPYDEVKLAYNAAVAGAQTLTVTSVIPGTAVYLVDNEEGTETLMNEGSEYNFTSAAGLNSERFAVKTIIDVTGIEENTAETSSVSAVVAGDAVKIYGATAGETIDVYTVNGVLVSSAVAVEGENEISVPTQGVLIVKVGDEVVKIVK